MQQLVQDVGYGLRLMRRAPGFTTAVVLTLAIGIGANAATFSIVNILALTPLTYKEPERVAFVFGWNAERQQRRFNLPLADAMDIRSQTQTLADVAAYQYWSANLTGIAVPERIQAYRVTANTFSLLGVDAAHGRALIAGDGRADAPDVVVLSHGLWQRRFGGSPSVVGQTVTLDGRPHTIVGVMPSRFEFPVFNFKGEAWTPFTIETAAGTRESSPSIVAIARLKPAVSYREAQAELDTVMRRLETDHPRTNRGLGGRILEMRRLGDEFGAGSISFMLLVRAVGRLRHINPGFNRESVLTMTISLPEYRYGDAATQRTFFTAALERVQRLAGVRDAAFVNVLPFSTYDGSTRYVTSAREVEVGREPTAAYRVVTPAYFSTLEIPVIAGRRFDSRDGESGQPVAIVNHALARRAFGSADPVGRQLRPGRANSTDPWRTIVGVVGDVLHSELTKRPDPEIYVPFRQAPVPMMFLAARTIGDPDRMVDPVRAALASVDPSQPVYHIKSLRALVDAALLPNTTAMAMMTLFAALALVLAGVGIYGVTSYAVTQQAREFGVRLALGAAPVDMWIMVIRRGLTLVGVGAAIGAMASVGVGRVLAAVVPGVNSADAPTYVTVGAILFTVGAAACSVPARRAMRLDPVEILRAD